MNTGAQACQLRLRLQAQMALLGWVHPLVRAVGVALDESLHRLHWHAVLDAGEAEAHAQALDALSCAATELISHYGSPWEIEEHYTVSPQPAALPALPLPLVFRRWEPDERPAR
ncbi:hypothetical protein VITFI_CDS0837 [Vitreoscilla filiformis]|jgi:hypothetical protein|uniref:Uncharacterized protein n=1 Tax=Vitreoscilla filiformis TaxID=63 RepID=A0A221KCA6_VITFI|nr:hypothetical protein [Vitreoscilla filiformis]ASM76615.1 hypothetical protein VITFI_CDS0837 [Vitreoscilla filiformis]